jgi:hypothetical protein
MADSIVLQRSDEVEHEKDRHEENIRRFLLKKSVDRNFSGLFNDLYGLGWRKYPDKSYTTDIYVAPWIDIHPNKKTGQTDIKNSSFRINTDYWNDTKKLVEYGQEHNFKKIDSPSPLESSLKNNKNYRNELENIDSQGHTTQGSEGKSIY